MNPPPAVPHQPSAKSPRPLSAAPEPMGSDTAKLIVVSGPSGSGKTSVLERVLARAEQPLVLSVSATTRPPRPGEVDGRDYYFLNPAEFQRRRAAGEFLECFEVYAKGYWYGTLKSEVAPRLADGHWVVLDVDVQGAQQVLREYPKAVTIFIRPSSTEVLRSRLEARGTETPETMARRLDAAKREIDGGRNYRYHVINDDLDQAVERFCHILSEIGDPDRC